MEKDRDTVDFYLMRVEDKQRTYKERAMAAKNLHKRFIDDIEISNIRFQRIFQVIENETHKIESGWNDRVQMFHHMFAIAVIKIKKAIDAGENGQVREYLTVLVSNSMKLIERNIDHRIWGIAYEILRESESEDTVIFILKRFDENYNRDVHYELMEMKHTLIWLLEKPNLALMINNVITAYNNLCEKAPTEIRTNVIEAIIEHFR